MTRGQKLYKNKYLSGKRVTILVCKKIFYGNKLPKCNFAEMLPSSNNIMAEEKDDDIVFFT